MEGQMIVTGRRASDKWLQSLIQTAIEGRYATFRTPLETPESKTRRPRRTKAQLKAAYVKALEHVQQQHGNWRPKRQRIRASNLVKMYQY